ncbi:carboxypeptidase-like regulatory domain-containing protein [Actinokineospora auranticolor]|uniref:carboxypeptidase-like regulatory domain-containing protein n=1 Tax=Actinokineospora auranticolor TaxID=155976 RepID=UPI0011B0EE61|nr:carboxypeptidase-like regulatory domain-containing protein [Actinokineospora auranticolor]
MPAPRPVAEQRVDPLGSTERTSSEQTAAATTTVRSSATGVPTTTTTTTPRASTIPSTTTPTGSTTNATSATTTSATPTAPETTTTVSSTTPAAESPDLRVTAEFTQPSYDIRDYAYIRLSVTNVGTATATAVTIESTGQSRPSFPPLWRIEPGATVEVKGDVALFVLPGPGPLAVSITLRSDEPDANPSDNTVNLTTIVTQVRADFTGVIYGDANRDGIRQPGEEIAGALVTTTGGRPEGTYSTSTGADGRFAFSDIPAGEYATRVEASGWRFGVHHALVDKGKDPAAEIDGLRPLADVLTVSMRFDEEANRAAELAPLTVKLTNRGSVPVRGVNAKCDSSSNDGSDWGDLNSYEGVTIPPSTTRTLRARTMILAWAPPGSEASVTCDFFVRYTSSDFVRSSATTRVLPGFGTLTGSVMRADSGVSLRCWPPGSVTARCGYPTGPGVPDIKIYLSDSAGKVSARAVTDRLGDFAFPPVMPGPYSIKVVGPWRMTQPDVFSPYNISVGTTRIRIWVVPGPDQPDPDSTPSAPPTTPQRAHRTHPAPSNPTARANGLAHTGADMAWQTGLGLLSVLFGALLVHRVRRSARRDASTRRPKGLAARRTGLG